MNIEQALNDTKKSAYSSRAKRTADTYKYGLKEFAEHLGGEGMALTEDIGKLTIEAFIDFPAWLAEHGFSKQTMGVYMASVRFFLDWLVIRNYLHPDYQETLRFNTAIDMVFKRRETKLPRFPRRGVAEKIRDAVYDLEYDTPVKERNIALVEFLYSTGCRNNEAAQLEVKDLDFSENSARVIGKGSKERKVFFGQKAAEAIRKYFRARKYEDKTSPVFARHDRAAGKKHNKITNFTVRNIVDDCVVVAGFERGSFTPHYFRHAFAIKMLSETHDLALVQDLMGHAEPSATRVYAKIYPEDLKEAHNKVYK